MQRPEDLIGNRLMPATSNEDRGQVRRGNRGLDGPEHLLERQRHT